MIRLVYSCNEMRIVQLTPGAGGMYCGSCLRDNALVAALRRRGHTVTMIPLYLPLTTDEADQSAGTPVFYGGINVYLGQKVPVFRRLPKWAHQVLDSPRLLRWLGSRASSTQPAGLGELTISMLQGESGNQARELDELVQWLQNHEHPDIISLSNALLAGSADRLKEVLGSIVTVTLQGEDAFLDALPEKHRRAAWKLAAQKLSRVNLIVAPSRYYANHMAERLGLPRERIQVLPNGISPDGWAPSPVRPDPPVLGFLARMTPEKGLDFLVDAYIRIRRAQRIPNLRLHVAGSLVPSDHSFVEAQKRRLRSEGLLGSVEFHPNLDHGAKQAFVRGLSVLSVPAHYGEAFGLYLLEAMASGVPVVQPHSGAFPEILTDSGAGLISKQGDPGDLANSIERVLLNPGLAGELSKAGLAAFTDRYTSDASARQYIELCLRAANRSVSAPVAA